MSFGLRNVLLAEGVVPGLGSEAGDGLEADTSVVLPEQPAIAIAIAKAASKAAAFFIKPP
jgi:hypothetical protein